MDKQQLQILNENRLSLVHPVLAARVMELIGILEAEDINILVTQGLRTYNEQERLYARGRTAPGPKVTDCQPGHSWHNFGLAVDVCPEEFANEEGVPVAHPDWNVDHPAWHRIHEAALELGFACGADFRTFPDMPHLQMTGKWPAAVPDAARQDFMEGGIPQVWAAADLILV